MSLQQIIDIYELTLPFPPLPTLPNNKNKKKLVKKRTK